MKHPVRPTSRIYLLEPEQQLFILSLGLLLQRFYFRGPSVLILILTSHTSELHVSNNVHISRLRSSSRPHTFTWLVFWLNHQNIYHVLSLWCSHSWFRSKGTSMSSPLPPPADTFLSHNTPHHCPPAPPRVSPINISSALHIFRQDQSFCHVLSSDPNTT